MERPTIVYHLSSRTDYESDIKKHKSRGVFLGNQKDGFLHMSIRDEVARSARLYLKDVKDLVALEIDLGKCTSRIEWDFVASRNCEFPHSYGPIPVDAIIRVIEIPYDEEEGRHDLSSWA